MKKVLIVMAIIFMFLSNVYGQFSILISPKLYVSQGITYNNNEYTGTLGMHYFFTSYFGVSIQTNILRDFGWYYDIAALNDDFKLIGSVGYSANHNSISYSLRLGYKLNLFRY